MNDFAAILLSWFRENGRELPWRGTKDPYAIWLSEIILQQTQVKQGWDYWERFMRHWPTVEALAAATEDEVLREWQGLGYYSRARNLHTAAQQIVARGGFPTTIEGIKQLKGVGDYTAAAIGSIAFGLPAAVVDGNVYRVLSRYYGISTPINTTEGKKEFQALAQSLLPTENGELPTENGELRTERCDYFQDRKTPQQANHTSQFSPLSSLQAKRTSSSAQFNQAIMDFGAIQCTPTKPQCQQCPLQDTCTALREGRIAELPVKQKTLKVKERRLTYIYIRCQGMTAIRRRPAGDIWQGLYEPYTPPALPEGEECLSESSVLQALPSFGKATGRRVSGNGAGGGLVLLAKQVKHVLTHRVLYADFYLWEPAERPQLPPDYFWIKEEDLGDYAVPRLIEILLSSLTSITTKKK